MGNSGRNTGWLILMALVFAASGCGRTGTSDMAEYLQWVNDPAHGLVVSRTVGGLRITVKYLPPEYRVFRELQASRKVESPDAESRTKAERRNAQSVAVLFTIAPDSTAGVSVGLIDPLAVAAQGAELNAALGEHLRIRADGHEYAPALSTLDNDGGIRSAITITAVFVDEGNPTRLVQARNYEVVFDDPMFGTGISHFSFSREKIDERVKLNF